MKIANSASGNDDGVTLHASLFAQFEVHSGRVLANIDKKNLVFNTKRDDESEIGMVNGARSNNIFHKDGLPNSLREQLRIFSGHFLSFPTTRWRALCVSILYSGQDRRRKETGRKDTEGLP